MSRLITGETSPIIIAVICEISITVIIIIIVVGGPIWSEVVIGCWARSAVTCYMSSPSTIIARAGLSTDIIIDRALGIPIVLERNKLLESLGKLIECLLNILHFISGLSKIVALHGIGT